MTANETGQAQTPMLSAKVIDRADQLQALFQGGGQTGRGATPARQRGQALAEGGVEPFNERRIESAGVVGASKQHLNLSLRSLENTAGDADHTAVGVLLDDLGNTDVLPGLQPRRPRRPVGMAWRNTSAMART